MDKLLKKLFSYQEFENDKELLKLKLTTEDKYDGFPLSDEALEYAYGGTNKELEIGKTVSFKVGNEIKTGKIIQINGNKILIDKFGWIDISQIN